jgi:hypothetical protein
MPKILSNDFRTDHLSPAEKKVANIVRRVMPSRSTGGGCQAFYSPKEWAERKEKWGLDSLLILCHDGGDLARFCNLNYGDTQSIERLSEAFKKHGMCLQGCTSWYSAVYEY